MRIGRGALIRGLIGITVSLVAIFILLRSVDVAEVVDILRAASPAWIGVMVLATLVNIGARGRRWQTLLAPIAKLPYRRVLGYTYVGYLANNILPARLGELVRSHALGEGEGISRTTVLGTVVVERIVDTVMVVSIAAASVLVLSARGVMSSAVLLGLAFVTLLVVGLGLGMAAHRLPGADRVVAFLDRWPRMVELGRRLRDGLRVAGRPRTLAAAIALSALAWGASITTFLAGGQAVGIELTLAQGALVATGVALATIVPSGPGFVGTFELTAAAIITPFGIDHDTAVAMAVLVHATILVVTSVGGAIAAIRMRIGLTTGAGDTLAGPDPDDAPSAADDARAGEGR